MTVTTDHGVSAPAPATVRTFSEIALPDAVRDALGERLGSLPDPSGDIDRLDGPLPPGVRGAAPGTPAAPGLRPAQRHAGVALVRNLPSTPSRARPRATAGPAGTKSGSSPRACCWG